MIVFDRVSKSFGESGGRGGAATVALADVSLAIQTGEIFGVIGPSGAGKSTLIRLVNLLERPSAGRILVDDRDLGKLGPSELRAARRSIGMIFQHFNLLSSRTAFGNVALPLELAGVPGATVKRRVDELLDLVGLADKRDRHPAELSGGQKQRVGIARALAAEPKVLLSDEATSALDPETTRSILDLLGRINRELRLTIVLITHELSVVERICGRVAVLDRGHVVETGTVPDVFARPSHSTTRTLLAGAATGLPGIAELRPGAAASLGDRTILRIGFARNAGAGPVIGQLARRLSLDVDVLSAKVDEVSGEPFGSYVIAIGGGSDTADLALRYLQSRSFNVETIGHVPADLRAAS